MHASPSDLRVVQRDDLLLRFAVMGDVTYVVVELPEAGSAGTTLEERCVQPHWGLVLRGEVSLERADQRISLPTGRVFHVAPGGPPHRFLADGSAALAGFSRLDAGADVSDEAIARLGFDVVHDARRALGQPTVPAPRLELLGQPPVRRAGRVDVQAVRMGGLLCCQARLRATTGYDIEWCDQPHWGLVLSGELTVDAEDQAELIAAGDAYYCPPGPPGHRFETADEATIVDFTPLDSFGPGVRASAWRPRARTLEAAL
ncbi:MAG TPA: hypothetical protein VF763_04200 [Candidatus Limnocylindrales bacterium]